jgi:hypothetical protein
MYYISRFAKNLQHVDKVMITLYNPTTVSQSSLFRKMPIESTVCFEKCDHYLHKTFYGKDLGNLIDTLNCFIENEIKTKDK